MQCPLEASKSRNVAVKEVLVQMREARQEDKVQAILTLRFAGAAAFKQRHKCQDYLDIEDD